MISDILNKKIYIPEGQEFGAKGAAMIAYSSITKISLKNKIFNQNKISKIFVPNKKNILNTKKSINIINIYQESYLMFKNINELNKISKLSI